MQSKSRFQDMNFYDGWIVDKKNPKPWRIYKTDTIKIVAWDKKESSDEVYVEKNEI